MIRSLQNPVSGFVTLLARLMTVGLLLGLVTFAKAFAAAPSQINLTDQQTLNIKNNFEYALDKDGKFSATEVLANHLPFKVASEDDLNQDHTNSVYWVRLAIHNQSKSDRWALATSYPTVNIKIYEITGDKALNPEFQTPTDLRTPSAHLRLNPGETREYLVRISSEDIVNLELQVIEQNHLYKKDAKEAFFLAVMLGCCVAMFGYNLFLYLTLREPVYFYYLLFVAMNVYTNLISVNFPVGVSTLGGVDWLATGNAWSNVAPLSAFIFVRSFMNSPRDYPRLDRTFKLYMVGLFVFFVAELFPGTIWMATYNDMYFLLGIFILMAGSVISFRNGFKPSSYFFVSLLAYLIGLIVYITHSLGSLPTNMYTSNAHVMGECLELFLTSIALGNRIKTLGFERSKALMSTEFKGQLLRVVSHDIANPLSVIKSVAYYQQSREGYGERMPMILRAVDMIDDILKYVRKSESVDSRKSIQVEQVSIADVFESLKFLFAEKASDKDLKLDFEMQDADMMIRADRTSFVSEVMSNILSNAIKFSVPGKSIKIKARFDNQSVHIAVIDQGVGMSRETLENLFNPSKNTTSPGTIGETGTGYGMPLVKIYVDLFGGDIRVTSKLVGEHGIASGTRFDLTFPRVSPFLVTHKTQDEVRLRPQQSESARSRSRGWVLERYGRQLQGIVYLALPRGRKPRNKRVAKARPQPQIAED